MSLKKQNTKSKFLIFNLRKVLFYVFFILLGFILCLYLIYFSFWKDNSNFKNCGTGGENQISLPIVMYHHILEKSKLLGKFVVTPTEFEEDLKYIKSKGYTPILSEDLINFYEKGTPLPEKPIMITFDDGYKSFKSYAVPILTKYNMKAIVSPIGYFSESYSESSDENLNYAHLTYNDLKEISNNPLVEIGNHTYNLHSNTKDRMGSKIKPGENVLKYKEMLKDDLLKLEGIIKENTGKNTTTFAYPFGYTCNEARQVVKEFGFKVSLSCSEKINILYKAEPTTSELQSNKGYINITKNTGLYDLGRFNRPHNVDTKSFYDKILK